MKKLLLLSLTCLLAGTLRAQLSHIDMTFDPGSGFGGGSVYDMTLQPDGKILAVGFFDTYNGAAANRCVRINANGSKDNSFNVASATFGFAFLYSVAVQADGKILVGGDFLMISGSPRDYLLRLNSDGTVDESFDAGTTITGTVRQIAVQPDGKILANGLRLNSDGSPDASFTGPAGGFSDFVLLPSGKIQAITTRLNANGTVDASYNVPANTFDGPATNLGVQPDGKIVVIGDFDNVDGEEQHYLARLNANGTVDGSYPFVSGLAFVNMPPRAIAIQPNGKIIVGGYYRLVRRNADGSPDPSFQLQAGQSGPNNYVNSVLVQPDGKIIGAGPFTEYDGVSRKGIVRLIGGEATAVGTLPHADAIQAYPNPTHGRFTISADATIQSVSVADVTGRVVVAQPVQSQSANLDLGPFAPGLYLVQATTAAGILNLKVVRE